ncbi:hypothetical protein CGH85_23675 [Vibrio parahaemolyticus]|nr:hypothetical protein [Vibrio parahaemolyticus]EGQ9247977.1 hypothetical protein [Vibrio parahaemolyticus]EJU9841370.1 hypothetical protein [Vibrio parahaemolyticus]EKO5219695.1 hypothetical protein [Vibrio parahaemolyticus]ELB2269815.1 hypothetical protein [Vibrio parahaemolyticus]MBM5082585.1 hypothetical protein [Vibrio parahaemolyticus]
MNQQEYDKTFDVGKSDSGKLQAAFSQVSDIRKFEIELYWKRATYFWALIVVAFAGYFSVLSTDVTKVENKYFLSLVIACIGFVFTFAWFLSCRGSKYWQENWENHMDLLEDAITGPLYKTLLERPDPKPFFERLVTGPLSVSVSKVNQWVAVFVLFCWLSLVCFSLYKSVLHKYITMPNYSLELIHGLVIFFALLCCALMFGFGKTHKKAQNPTVVGRYVKIKE